MTRRRRGWRAVVAGAGCLFALAVALPAGAADGKPVVVGSKRFTESYILGEIVRQTLQAAGTPAEHRRGLGNTGILEQALASGAVDVYPEYTGTIVRELLKRDGNPTLDELNAQLAPRGLKAVVPLGFNNTYALAMREAQAAQLGITRISDLLRPAAAGLRLGLSHEFLERTDGWPALKQAYGLPLNAGSGLDHGLAYEAIKAQRVDLIDIYSTDAKVGRERLRVLVDDRGHFPKYDAVLLMRAGLDAAPLRRLAGRIDTAAMVAMNAQVELDGIGFDEVARQFVARNGVPADAAAAAGAAPAGGSTATPRPAASSPSPSPSPFPSTAAGAAASGGFAGGVSMVGSAAAGGAVRNEAAATVAAGAARPGWLQRLFAPDLAGLAVQHLLLVFGSLAAAVLTGVPLGVLAWRWPRGAGMLLGAVAVLQTVPSLALLAFLIALLGGIGLLPALIALWLYALLPIVRNTHAGLQAVAGGLTQAALSLGMTPRQALWLVQLPLAAPTVLAGVKTAAVINVGTATMAAFIGAGGFGERIVAGLAVNDSAVMLAGALPAAALALLVQGAFDVGERWLPGARRGGDRR